MYTHSYSFNDCTYIRLSVPLVCLNKQAGIIIRTIQNLWEILGIEGGGGNPMPVCSLILARWARALMGIHGHGLKTSLS